MSLATSNGGLGMETIVRQKRKKQVRHEAVHGFLPQELLAFALPARRSTEMVWTRRNGDYTFIVTAGTILDPNGETVTELPSGKYARAAMLFLCTQAKLTGDPTLKIGEGYRSLMDGMGMEWQGVVRGKEAIRQLMLVSAATFTISRQTVNKETGEEHYQDEGARFSQAMDLWTTRHRAGLSETRASTVTLSPMFMEMMRGAAPISMKSWQWLLGNSKSPMTLDVYAWLCGRLYRCDSHARVTWQQLYGQFGSAAPLKRFKQHFREALATALLVFPEARISEDAGTSRTKGFKGFHLSPSPDPRDSKIPGED
ncbi:hypothetical protein ACTXL7_14875 [Arthrobacter rhombi]